MVVVGGYESGIDAAVNLVEKGVENYSSLTKMRIGLRVKANQARYCPRTFERLDRVMADDNLGNIRFVKQRVSKIVDTYADTDSDKVDDDLNEARFNVYSEDGSVFI